MKILLVKIMVVLMIVIALTMHIRPRMPDTKKLEEIKMGYCQKP